MPSSKTTTSIVAGGGALALGAVVLMQQLAAPSCPVTDACISWGASPGYENNGGPFPAGAAIQYRVYRVVDATHGAKLATVNGLSYQAKNEPRGKQCYVVSTVADGVEGVPTKIADTACKTIRFAGPTNGAIEAPSDGAIESK